MRESGVVERLSKTVQNELMNITTIFLGVSVGATTTATAFLNYQTLAILVIGILAFALGSAGGVLLAKFMNLFTKNKINPLIGSAGVSAVPMAARVSQTVGQEANPGNFLLMHAMGPNVAELSVLLLQPVSCSLSSDKTRVYRNKSRVCFNEVHPFSVETVTVIKYTSPIPMPPASVRPPSAHRTSFCTIAYLPYR